MTRQTFLQGAFILMIAGMITRFLGFLNRLVMARLMGEEGVGLYMMVIPSLFLIMTLTQVGLPVAISKRVAEANAKNDKEEIKKIIRLSCFIIGLTSIIFTSTLFLFSSFITTRLLTDPRTIYPLLAMLPMIPFIAFSSVIKGYFQGMHNMKPQSYALIIEQVVRVILVIFFVRIFLPYGVQFAAAAAMLSVFFGELSSFLYLYTKFKGNKLFTVRTKMFATIKRSKQTMKSLFSIALPSTGSRLINSISSFIEPILVTQSLAIAGVSTLLITKQYGELMGYVLPLLFLPTFITNSLSIAIVPAISDAEAVNNRSETIKRIQQTIRISLASGAIATVTLTKYATPILTYIYGSSNGSPFLTLMAPFFILLYIQTPMQASLQALDLAQLAMWNSFIGNIVKLTIIFMLGSHPNFQMNGVVIGMIVGVLLITILHYVTLKKTIQFFMKVNDIMQLALLLVLTWFASTFTYNLYVCNETFISLSISLLILFIIYIVLLFLLNIISRKELKQIPIIKDWFN